MDKLFFLELKCSKTKEPFYARFDYAADDMWALTYGLKTLPEGQGVTSEGAQQDISVLRVGPQYKCPYCGSTNFVRCGACGKLTCYDDGGKFSCAHCPNKGTVSGHIEKIDVSKTGRGQ